MRNRAGTRRMNHIFSNQNSVRRGTLGKKMRMMYWRKKFLALTSRWERERGSEREGVEREIERERASVRVERYLIHGHRYLIHGHRYLIHGHRYLIHGHGLTRIHGHALPHAVGLSFLGHILLFFLSALVTFASPVCKSRMPLDGQTRTDRRCWLLAERLKVFV